ncbi:uncharacterized protein LOC107413970 isoform X3 [Ziziphus jujuba]|uniref:Uncharacterized protein LOC107413970 isoform X3 n=1 Tax=Ziziphus jujuba TaxID=326968 RepID=A0A6P3ZH64_ZIZJJ|nr:uncharacterized protein LOC107413970 isoform X3 [Ziziphus jujuba]
METTKQRRLRVRKPLSDCTNTLNSTSQSSSSSSSSSFALVKRQNPNLSSALKRLLSHTNPNSQSTTTATAKSADRNDVVPKPSSTLLPPVAAPTTPRPLRSSSSASGVDDRKVSEPCSVYTRRHTAEKRKSKGKTIAEPSTCIPTLKTRKIGEEIKEDGGDGLSKARTVPRKKKQRQIPSEKDVAMHALPRDFIEQQRAYFAEIDAFELPEEEVESVEELD